MTPAPPTRAASSSSSGRSYRDVAPLGRNEDRQHPGHRGIDTTTERALFERHLNHSPLVRDRRVAYSTMACGSEDPVVEPR